MKILLTGATGFVGKGILRYCADSDITAAPSLRNITSDNLKRIIEESGCDTIVHTAAVSDIGECEKNPEESYIANVKLPLMLAENAGGRKLVCFSSDQVYSGHESGGPFKECETCPDNLYSRQKLEMEERVLNLCPDSVMLRAEWMYDMYSSRGNYVKNMLSADDEVKAGRNEYRGVTYLKEVAENLTNFINLSGGAYNFGSETDKSMYQITEEFLCLLGKNIKITDSNNTKRLWMDCSKATKQGVIFINVTNALKRWRDEQFIIHNA